MFSPPHYQIYIMICFFFNKTKGCTICHPLRHCFYSTRRWLQITRYTTLVKEPLLWQMTKASWRAIYYFKCMCSFDCACSWHGSSHPSLFTFSHFISTTSDWCGHWNSNRSVDSWFLSKIDVPLFQQLFLVVERIKWLYYLDWSLSYNWETTIL